MRDPSDGGVGQGGILRGPSVKVFYQHETSVNMSVQYNIGSFKDISEKTHLTLEIPNVSLNPVTRPVPDPRREVKYGSKSHGAEKKNTVVEGDMFRHTLAFYDEGGNSPSNLSEKSQSA